MNQQRSLFKQLKDGFNQLLDQLTGQQASTPPPRPPRSRTAPFSPTPQKPMTAQQSPAPPPRITHPVKQPPPAPAQQQARPAPQAEPRRPTKPLAPNSLFKDGRYQILTPRQLEHGIYYDAADLRCQRPNCQATHEHVPPNGLCRVCNQGLDVVLIHEHHQPVQRELQSSVLQLGSAGHPQILRHRDMLALTKATFTVLEHPGQWGVVVRGRRPRSIDDALAIVGQVAFAFTFLHQQGFAYTQNTQASWRTALENILILPGNEVRVADLSIVRRLPANPQARQQAIHVDIAFLGQLLLYLATDIAGLPGNINQAPDTLYPVIEGTRTQHYASVMEFIQDMRDLPDPASGRRPLKPTHGQATHPGRRHSHNEDAIVTFTYNKEQGGQSVPIGFYLVADGMGGHDAGDLASRTVNQIVTEWVLQTKVLPDLRKSTRKLSKESITEELLQDAIQRANQVLLNRAQKQGSDLGSTVTAALIIGNAVTIVNVGDSRTYLLRQGRLEQVTQDHSLVARLLEAHVIAPNEVRQHPRRNEIYRSLGQEQEIDVDTFAFSLTRGDRLILCCDGLWEMVEDAQIQQIVEGAKTPQQACDTLIKAANKAGGEDNISVIVVEME